ncbi:MAG: oxidoreductase, partial [Actinomycetes bacterium]
VARAAARLVLVTRGLDPGAVSVPEVGHVELGPSAYAEALAAYAAGGPDGISTWVGHCARAVVLGAREGVAVCEAIQRGA